MSLDYVRSATTNNTDIFSYLSLGMAKISPPEPAPGLLASISAVERKELTLCRDLTPKLTRRVTNAIKLVKIN